MKKSLVLIIDDDDIVRKLYKDALEISGFATVTAKNGAEGIATALEQHPDLLLVDLIMPDCNGYEAVQKIREDDWGKTAKVLFLTNYSELEGVFEAIQLQSDEYMIKSRVEIKDIINRVRTMLDS